MKPWLWIRLDQQRLCVIDNGIISKAYPISTATNGPGEQIDSGCTPRGWHYIRAKIGHGQPLRTVFVGRRPTGEIYCPQLADQYPDRDWILTRILWLCGLEIGVNRLGNVDTFRRYIYIHGSPDHAIQGTPRSHGCIRMGNADVEELYELVLPGTRVWLTETGQFPPSWPDPSFPM